MTRQLFTIGYEGVSIDSFVVKLKGFGVNCIIDVREIPLSRKRGFSKTKLIERFGQENIYYFHFKELGSPKSLRDKLKATHDYPIFFEKVGEHLAKNAEAIGRVCNYIDDNICCLMCFEHLATQCHRTIVARKVKEADGNGLQIVHI